MDKNDLLKRFSKVHNRALQSLNEIIKDPTEAIEQRTKEAGGLLKNAPWTPLNPNNPQGTQTAQVGQGTVNWNPKNNKVSNNSGEALYDPNAGTVSPIPGKSEKRFKSFISSIVPYESPSDFEKSETPKLTIKDEILQYGIDNGFISQEAKEREKTGKRGVPAGLTIGFLFSKLGFDPSLQSSAREVFQSIRNRFFSKGKFDDKVYDSIKQFVNVKSLTGFFFGATDQSLERRLAKDSFKLSVDPEGNVTQEEIPPDPEERLKVAERIDNLLAAAKGDKEACESIKSYAIGFGAAPSSREDVVLGLRKDRKNRYLLVSPEGEDIQDGKVRSAKTQKAGTNAVAIPDNSGVYSAALMAAQKGCGQRQNNPALSLPIDNTGGDNANRGFALEEVPLLGSLVNLVNSGQGDTDCFKGKLKDSVSRVREKVGRLNSQKEKWADSSEQIMDSETAGLISFIDEAVDTYGAGSAKGDPVNSIISGMAKFGSKINSRGSLIALPAGKVTGQGRRQDVLEVFEDCDKANEALSKSGNNFGATPVEMNLSDLKSGDKNADAILDCATKEGKDGSPPLIPADGKVCVINNSLKNYMDLNKGVTGGSITRAILAITNKLMRNPEELDRLIEEADDPRVIDTLEATKTARDTYRKMTGMSEEEFAAAQSVLAVLDSNSAAIQGIPDSANVITDDEAGTVIDGYSPQKLLNKIVRSTICSDLNLGDTPGCGEITTLIDTFDESRDPDGTKLRAKIAALANSEYLGRLIDQDNPAARDALKMLMLNAGGDSTDTLGLEIRTLKDGQIYGFKHNQPLQDFFDNPDSWELERESGSSRFRARSPDGGYIEFETSVDKNGKTSYILHYSSELVRNYNKQGYGSDPKQVESTVVESIERIEKTLSSLKEKMAIFNTNEIT